VADVGGGVISVDAASPDGGGVGSGDPSNVPAFTFRSGTRIRVRTTTTTITTADGASHSVSEFAGWFDRELGEECVPAVASDGLTRCLPKSTVSASKYSDNRCTVRLAGVDAPTPRPAYIGIFVPETSGFAIFPSGDAFPKADTIYEARRSSSGTFCEPVSQSPTETWYAVSGPEIAPTQFVAMTTTTTITTQ
jgi:hypothetical protein